MTVIDNNPALLPFVPLVCRNNSMMTFAIPEGLNLADQLRAGGYHHLSKPLILDKFHYLIDRLTKGERRLRASEYLPINTELLRKVVGKRFATKIKDALLHLKVIEANGSYRAGHTSQGYRLSRNWARKPVESYPISDRKLTARIKESHQSRFLRARMGSNALERIGRTLEMVQIDFGAADRYMHTTQFPTERSRTLHADQINAWRERRLYLSRDKQGRVHHNFVALANELKSCATIGGKPIHSMDVSNMQPALLSLLYTEPSKERDRFVDLVKTNRFYQWFNSHLLCPFDEAERRKLKEMVLAKVIFCHNAVQHELSDHLKLDFPILAAAIHQAKMGNHGRLARRLQSIEARVIIDGAIGDLVKTYPSMPILSVHDCIATTQEFIEPSKAAMEKAISEELGFALPVKEKRITN